MLKNLLIISTFILVSFVSFAGGNNTCKIQGQVTDKEDKEVLTGVQIYIAELNQTVYSDFDGNFEIPNLDKTKKYTVTVSFISYQDQVLAEISPKDLKKALSIALIKE